MPPQYLTRPLPAPRPLRHALCARAARTGCGASPSSLAWARGATMRSWATGSRATASSCSRTCPSSHPAGERLSRGWRAAPASCWPCCSCFQSLRSACGGAARERLVSAASCCSRNTSRCMSMCHPAERNLYSHTVVLCGCPKWSLLRTYGSGMARWKGGPESPGLLPRPSPFGPWRKRIARTLHPAPRPPTWCEPRTWGPLVCNGPDVPVSRCRILVPTDSASLM
eukprot:5735999-Prymnesium_polylepis.1